ncbi:MAG: hypothetical protein GY772_23795, partial [bacterium]|nr:hypothetical protein [bacterium]
MRSAGAVTVGDAAAAAPYAASEAACTGDPDWARPLWFEDGNSSELVPLRALVTAIGEARVVEATARLAAHHVAKKDKVAMQQLRPKGGGRDTVERLDWLPNSMRDTAGAPQALRTFGAPWLLSQEPRTHRTGAETYPLVGFGHFLVPLAGEALVVVWPMSPLIRLGIMGHRITEWMAGWAQSRLVTWLQENATHLRIAP